MRHHNIYKGKYYHEESPCSITEPSEYKVWRIGIDVFNRTVKNKVKKILMKNYFAQKEKEKVVIVDMIEYSTP